MSELSDMDLLKRYSEEQSEEAFGILVSRHIPLVYSVALRRVRDPHLAEEIAQTVFTILARKASGLSPKTIVTGWLYRTANFASTAVLRSEHRRKLREQQAVIDETGSDPTWEEIAPFLESAVSGLGEKDRCALLLHFFERKTLWEVGLALGTTEDAAQKRVSRALIKLRGSLAKSTSTPAASLTALGVLLSHNAVHAAPASLASSVTAVSLSGVASTTTTASLTSTLKLMAWTKTKTTLVTAALALLTLGLGTVVVMQFAAKTPPPGNFAGAWEGTLDVGDASLRLVTKMTRAADGSFSALLDSIDQGVKDVPVTKVTVVGKKGRFEMPALTAIFDGTLSPDEQEWSGQFTQLGRSHSLTFKRTDHPTALAAPIPDQALTARTNSALQGYWKGSLSVGPVRLRLAFKILEKADGKFAATLDSLDQGVRNLPVTDVTFHKPVVEIEVSGVGGFFEGKLNSKADQIVGKWTQAGKGMDLVLDRGEPEADPFAGGSLVAEGDDDLQGEWGGSIDQKELKLRIDLRIAKLPNGEFRALLDSPDQGAKGIPATRVTRNATSVRVEFAALSASYQGTLKSSKMTGTWQQGPAKLPLNFTRKKSN